MAAGKVDALRIDHPDGLSDSTANISRRCRSAPARRSRGARVLRHLRRTRARSIWCWKRSSPTTSACRCDWPVHGTTGYRYMNVVNGLFVDHAARARFDRLYAAFIGEQLDYDRVARGAQHADHRLFACE